MPEQVQIFIGDTNSAFGNNGGVTPAGANTTIATSGTVGPGMYDVIIYFEYTGAVGAADTASNVQFTVVPTSGGVRNVPLLVIPVTNSVTSAIFIRRAMIRPDMGATSLQVRSVAAGTTAIYNAIILWTSIVD